MKNERIIIVTVLSEQFLKPKEAATLLRVSISTLARWRHEGIGPLFSKLDTGSILYRKSNLIEFVNSFS